MQLRSFLFISLLIISMYGCSNKTSEQNTSISNVDLYHVKNKVSSTSLREQEPSANSEGSEFIYWKSKVGSKTFTWTKKDLFFQVGDQSQKSFFSDLAKSQFKFHKKNEDLRNCHISYSFRPSAIAKNLVSFEYEKDLSCGAVTSLSWGYHTFNLAKKGNLIINSISSKKNVESKSISLSDIFSENLVVKSLLENNKISNDIKKLIADGRLKDYPKSLEEIGSVFSKFPYDFFDGDFYLESNFHQNFTFYQLKEEKASVRISLTPNSHANQADHEYIEIHLPIPKEFDKALILANERKEGFLLKDARKLTGSYFVEFAN